MYLWMLAAVVAYFIKGFPEIAIRELLANAMIHQDLQQRGTNPMVEVFKKD